MTKELKQEFTLRITQANKTQLITILYEMVLLYLEEAKAAIDADDKTECKAAIRKIRGCMDELIASLHLEYELAQNLLQLYLYINKDFYNLKHKIPCYQTEPQCSPSGRFSHRSGRHRLSVYFP